MNSAALPAPLQLNENSRVTHPVLPDGDAARENFLNGTEHESTASSPAPRRNFWPVLKYLALAGLLTAAGLAAARFGREWWTVGRYIESTDDSYVGGDVTVIAPKVPGFIAQVAVTDNQPVRAGDLLIKLDDRDYLAALAKADATVAIQQAALTNLDAMRHLQEAVVAQAQAEIASADAEISRARDDQSRYQRLAADGAVSIQSSQKADAEYKQAFAAGEKTRASLAATQRQLSVIGTQKLQVQAALEQATAERELVRLNLSYTELRSPIDGVVGNRSARAGAYASTGSQLVAIVPTHALWIDANFKESQLAHIRAGMPALVKVDSLPGQVFRGHVTSLAPATGAQFSVLPPENATGNFTKIVQRVAVRITLDDEAAALGQLRPGLSVTAEVDGRLAERSALALAERSDR